MRILPLISLIAFTSVPIFAQSSTSETAGSSKHTVRMFAHEQYDSVLSLLPRSDSLRSGADIIGVGLDTAANAVVVIAFDQNGNPVKFVFPDSTLAKKTREQAPASAPRTSGRPDQRGRTWFIIETALKSAFVYPMAYQSAFKNTDEGVAFGLGLLTTGGSLYGTFAFTKNMELGYGRVGLMNYGSTFLGLHYPQLLASCLRNTTDIDKDHIFVDQYSGDTVYEGTTPTDQIKAWCSMLGFPLGIYLGSRWNIIDRNDGGKMTLMGFFSQPTAYFLGYGLPLFFINPGEDARAYFGMSSFLTMTLIPAGFYAGYTIAGDRQISAGRGALPYVSGIMGGMTGVAIPMLFYDSVTTLADLRVLASNAIIGYGVGTALGLLYHPSNNYSYWQTVFIGASAGAGALIAEAFPFIAKADKKNPFIIAGVLGAWTGFFIGERLSLSLFEKSDRDAHGPPHVSVSFPGLAALPMMLSKDSKITGSRIPALPMANLEWRF